MNLRSLILIFVFSVVSAAASAACSGYNTGGQIDCYNTAAEIPVSGQAPVELAAIDNMVKQHMLDLGIVNACVAIVNKSTGGLVYNRAFGPSISDWRSRANYGFFVQDTDCMSVIASLSKVVTRSLVYHYLIPSGKISLSDNAFQCASGNTGRAWIAGYTPADPRACRITIQNILDYKIGYEDMNVAFPPEKFQVALNQTMTWDPGTHFYQNNWGDQILGVVIERAVGTGENYEEIARRLLLRPAGISDRDMYLMRDSHPSARQPRNVWYNSNAVGTGFAECPNSEAVMDCGQIQETTSSGAWVATSSAFAKLVKIHNWNISGEFSGVETAVSDSSKFETVVFTNKFTLETQGSTYVLAGKIQTTLISTPFIPTVNYWVVSDEVVTVVEYVCANPPSPRSPFYFVTGADDEKALLAQALNNDLSFCLVPTGKTFRAWKKGYTGYDVARFIFDIKNVSGVSIGASHWYGLDVPLGATDPGYAITSGKSFVDFFHGLNPFRKPYLNGGPMLMHEKFTYSAYPAVNGVCSQAGTVPLYSVYNGAAQAVAAGTKTINDGNHRFATDTNVVAEMIARGWVADGVVYCARQ